MVLRTLLHLVGRTVTLKTMNITKFHTTILAIRIYTEITSDVLIVVVVFVAVVVVVMLVVLVLVVVVLVVVLVVILIVVVGT